MDESKAEIYKYLRDQHDKHVAGRESLISRFANIRLLAGLILAVFSFSISVVNKLIENAHAYLPRVIATFPLIFFAVALYYVTRALLTIPDLVGTIHIYFPAANRSEITKALEADDLDVDQVLEDLSYNYLEAIEKNIEAKSAAGEQLTRCVTFIRRGLLATITFLISTLLSSIIMAWLFTKI